MSCMYLHSELLTSVKREMTLANGSWGRAKQSSRLHGGYIEADFRTSGNLHLSGLQTSIPQVNDLLSYHYTEDDR